MIFYWQIILSPLPLRPEKAPLQTSQREGLLSTWLHRHTSVQGCDACLPAGRQRKANK